MRAAAGASRAAAAAGKAAGKAAAPARGRWPAAAARALSSGGGGGGGGGAAAAAAGGGEAGARDFGAAATYKETMRPPHEAFTIHPVAYSDARFFAEEQAKVFGKSWVCIATADKLKVPGDTVVSELGGQPIFAVRDKKGELNAFLNVCRHRGSKLVKADGRYPVVSCPYHRWGYALDGRLLATPMWDTTEGGQRFDKTSGERKTGSRAARRAAESRASEEAAAVVAEAERSAVQAQPCAQSLAVAQAFDTAHIKAFDKKDFSLFKVRVEQWGALVFATLGDEREVPPLREAYGDAVTELASYPMAELVSVRSKKYVSNCNWKILVDNFSEYYHLPTVHPALTTVSGVDNHHRRQGAGMYMGFVTHPLTAGGQPIDPGSLPSYPGLTGEQHLTAVFHHVWPNVFYFCLPSHFFVVRLVPVSATETIEYADLMVHPDLLGDAEVAKETQVLNKKLDGIMAFYDMVNLEDIDACELVQQGVRVKAYAGGRVSYRFEETIHRFQNMLIDHMVGKPGRIPLGDSDIPFYIGGLPDAEAAKQLKNPPSS
jgi:choline monooxygenase